MHTVDRCVVQSQVCSGSRDLGNLATLPFTALEDETMIVCSGSRDCIKAVFVNHREQLVGELGETHASHLISSSVGTVYTCMYSPLENTAYMH